MATMMVGWNNGSGDNNDNGGDRMVVVVAVRLPASAPDRTSSIKW